LESRGIQAKFFRLGVLKLEAKLTPKELRDNMVSYQLKEQNCRDCCLPDNLSPEAGEKLGFS